MPRVIVKSSYMTDRTHIVNYLRYIATREGVERLKPDILYRTATLRQRMFVAKHRAELEKLPEYHAYEQVPTVNNASKLITAYANREVQSAQEYREYAGAAREQPVAEDSRPATQKQVNFIEKHKTEAEGLPEYEDYLKNGTVGDASALIGLIAEQHPTDPTMYLRYIAERPGVETGGEKDGLFDLHGKADLEAECDHVLNSDSVVWAHIVSLRREDAERTGMDAPEAWRRQMAAEASKIASIYHISLSNLHVLGAFHNEGHHPHIHMLVYSDDPTEGKVAKAHLKTAGQKMRSAFTNAIFKNDLAQIKELKTKARDELRQQLRDFKKSLYDKDAKINPDIAQAVSELAKNLPETGKKQYAFLPSEMKRQVEDILRLVVRSEPAMKALSESYFDSERRLIAMYHDDSQTIEDKVADAIKHFYEPRTGPFAKAHDSSTLHNIIISCAQEIQGRSLLPDVSCPVHQYASDDTGERKDASLKIKQEALPVQTAEGIGDYTSARSSYQAGMRLLRRNPDENQKKRAFEQIKEAADKGHGMAQYRVAEMLRKGEGTEPNNFGSDYYLHKAFRNFTEEAEINGSAFAHFQLAKMYQNGEACFQDTQTAIEHFQIAAEQGHAESAYALGKMLLWGEDSQIEQFDQGISYLEKAVDMGHAKAALSLGELYADNGDEETAKQYIQIAAAYGSHDAREKLKQKDESNIAKVENAQPEALPVERIVENSKCQPQYIPKESVMDEGPSDLHLDKPKILQEPLVSDGREEPVEDPGEFPQIVSDTSQPQENGNVQRLQIGGVNVTYLVLHMLRDMARCLETSCNDRNTYANQIRQKGWGRKPRRQHMQKNLEEPYEH